MDALIQKLAKYDGLLSKPFSSKGDNSGVEMVIPRPLSPVYYTGETSSTSLLSIYDVYGIDVARLFAQYLMLIWERNQIGLHNYIYHSLKMCDPLGAPAGHTITTERAHSLLFTHLESMEESKPRMKEELTVVEHELPLEILASIIDSTRVCWSIRRLVLDKRRRSPLTSHELWSAHYELKASSILSLKKPERTIYISTDRDRDGRQIITRYSAEISTKPGEWSYQLKSNAEYRYNAIWIRECCSLSCHAHVYKQRGCADVNARMRELLNSIRSYPDDEMYHWILQFSIDMGREGNKSYASPEEARDDLHVLVERAWSALEASKC